MVSRTLERETDVKTGIIRWHPAYKKPDQTISLAMTRERMTDHVQPGDNHLFSVRRETQSGLVLSGKKTSGTGAGDVEYFNKPCGGPRFSSAYNHIFIGDKGDNVYATELLAETNPSRATVDIPVFLAELRDLPQLVKIVGDTALKTVSKANLSYWFGWKPLISDIMKLMDFSGAVNSRYKELKALYDGGLRRTRELDRLSNEADAGERVLNSTDYITWTAKMKKQSQVRIWGHVKWKPTTLPPKTDQELINLARRAALGLTIDPSTAWELIPFSWMVDWFSNVGSFLAAHRNTVPCDAYDLSIMRHQVTTSSFSNLVVSPGMNAKEGWIKREDKSRTPMSATLAAYLPYLSGRQWSILGSLAVLNDSRLGGRVR